MWFLCCAILLSTCYGILHDEPTSDLDAIYQALHRWRYQCDEKPTATQVQRVIELERENPQDARAVLWSFLIHREGLVKGATIDQQVRRLEWLAKEKADGTAKAFLAHYCFRGTIPDPDRRQAWMYLNQALDDGNADALGLLGEIHEKGLYGVKQDLAAAAVAYRASAERGHAHYWALASGCYAQVDDAPMLVETVKAGMEFNPACMVVAADWYRSGKHFQKDEMKANLLLIEAARRGHEPAKEKLKGNHFNPLIQLGDEALHPATLPSGEPK